MLGSDKMTEEQLDVVEHYEAGSDMVNKVVAFGGGPLVACYLILKNKPSIVSAAEEFSPVVNNLIENAQIIGVRAAVTVGLISGVIALADNVRKYNAKTSQP